MKRESVIKNYIFQFGYQALMMVIPLVLSPYLTRTLGKTGLGIYTYANSIAYYFTLLAMLGISRYGQRVVSACADDERILRKKFWSLYTVHCIFSVVAIILYLIFVQLLIFEDKEMFIIQVIFVASALFDVTWLFQGLENFSSVVIKNMVIRIMECISIFAFVKNPDDLSVYALISTLALLMGQLVMIPKTFKIVKPISFTIQDMKEHLKPLFVLAITIVAASLYTVFDKTLLGLMTTKENVAFYEYAYKIIKIPQTLISVAGTVLYPRACYMVARGDKLAQKQYFGYSLFITFFIGMGAVFGILAIGKPFVIIYYGEEFSVCGTIIMTMTPLILIIGIGESLRTQYMIPRKMDREFAFCLSMNAIINIVLSILLIPKLNVYGAVIGTTVAEIFGLCYQIYLCREFVSIIEIVKDSIPCACFGAIMYLIVILIKKEMVTSIKMLFFEMLLGITIFSLLTIIYLIIFKKSYLSFLRKRRN